MRTFRPAFTTQLTRLCLAVGTVSGVAAFGLGGHVAWADTCTTPDNGPTGPGASTFTYQCSGTYAGDWTNQYYSYDPSSGVQTPLYSPDYSYDCTTNTWTQADWVYDAASGAYTENRVAASAPPDQPTNCPTPAATTDTSSPTSTPATGSDSSSQPTTGNSTGTTDSNTVGSQATSGNATVANNDTAGNATTGNASDEITIENLVQSLSNASGSNVATFTSNVDGNVNGDIVLDPSAILASGSLSDPQIGPGSVSDNSSDTSIDNNVTASAQTGDASVVDNGTAGNATTGNASAIINLINMIDTAVAAGKSFIGTININGDLNGNILIPQSIIDQLLASNAGATSPNETAATTSTDESITNNLTQSAVSGDASVLNNGVGGNATTGNASNNVTILNLTGSSIIGQNVLLVFVNVEGQWVGMIVNAPTGATSAEFGGGITSDTTTPAPAAGGVVEADAQLSITNNVKASAQSGNALVANNGTAGNATSGNADTLVNILNMENSSLSLANWFGILFINVFGIWDGNFGILPTPAPTTPSTPSNGSTQTAYQPTHHFRHFASFLPFYSHPTVTTTADISNPTINGATAILGDAVHPTTASKLENASSAKPASGAHDNFALPAIGVLVAIILLGISERDRFTGRSGK